MPGAGVLATRARAGGARRVPCQPALRHAARINDAGSGEKPERGVPARRCQLAAPASAAERAASADRRVAVAEHARPRAGPLVCHGRVASQTGQALEVDACPTSETIHRPGWKGGGDAYVAAGTAPNAAGRRLSRQATTIRTPRRSPQSIRGLSGILDIRTTVPAIIQPVLQSLKVETSTVNFAALHGWRRDCLHPRRGGHVSEDRQPGSYRLVTRRTRTTPPGWADARPRGLSLTLVVPCTCTPCIPASPAGEQTLTPRFAPLPAATRCQGLAAARRGAWRRPRGYPAVSVVGGGGLPSRAAACRLRCRGLRGCVVPPLSRRPRAGTLWGGPVDAAVGYPARKCKPKLAALPVRSGVERT